MGWNSRNTFGAGISESPILEMADVLASEGCQDLGYQYVAIDDCWDLKDRDEIAISVGGKALGFPVCVEARGLLYNADAIKAATGEDFDPASIVTLDDFTAFCDKLVAAGMEAPPPF